MSSHRVNFVIFSVVLVVLGVVSAQPKWQSRIIGGRNVAKNGLPYMAGIFHYNGFFMENLGSAVILNSRIILSSASNIDGHENNLDQVIAVLGSPLVDENRRDEMVLTRIVRIILHPQFDANTRAFDLALLCTKEQIVFSNAIHPIELPTTDLNVENELQASVSGWGISEKTLEIDLDKTHHVEIMETSIISRDKCLSIYAELDVEEWNQIKNELTENNVCTMNNVGKFAPLVVDGAVVGVASRILTSTYPNVYTKIYPHLEWIQTKMTELK